MTDADACHLIADRLECLLAGNRQPFRVVVKPLCDSAFYATVRGEVDVSELDVCLATGANTCAILVSSLGETLIILE
jgi:hypothetical protein